jgi:DNA/RNA-binding domain of Phe-tRNA-synthetase-like protein
MPGFTYADEIVQRFPTVFGGVIHAVDVTNAPATSRLGAFFEAEQRATLDRVGQTPLAELPSIAAWRRVFRSFGVDPTGYRSAAEALLRRLTKQGSIPSISALVDLGNLVSIRYALPVAIFDLARLSGGITVRLANGDETFTDLGSGQRESPEPGEVVFVDEAGLVAARRWCWRQAAEAASTETTREVLVTVEGHHPEAHNDVTAAAADLEALLHEYAKPAAMSTGVVSSASPAVELVAGG